ncbi:MAG: A/G-specific adenine glycosylase, partial [Pseudomonadota bacterium]
MREHAAQLLAWYDTHGRSLPWRVRPDARLAGEVVDPYKVWLSEIMLQQTTVAAVKSYYEAFTSRWPTVHDLAAAEDADVMAAWAGLGYYARARNLLKCARAVVERYDGVFPNTEAELQSLPGIGPYTSAALAAIAFDRRATVLDGNVERVMARQHKVEEPLPDSKETLRSLAEERTPDIRPGDYAQAIMDLGATICTPRAPACGICPWMEGCAARLAGCAAELPRKRRKAPKPVRYGVVYFAQNPSGEVWLEERPAKGLLGGMLGLPGPAWGEEMQTSAPPIEAHWQDAGEVRHTFTHFHLQLRVMAALVGSEHGPFRAVSPKDLPTVF